MARSDPALIVSARQRKILERWVKAPRTPQALALRARLLLECARGRTDAEVAGELETSVQTVAKWRRRFDADGVEGLHDAPRSGAPRRIQAEDLERVLAITLLSRPAGESHWSTRALARACGSSQSSTARIWRGFGLGAPTREIARARSRRVIEAKFGELLRLYLDTPPSAAVGLKRVDGGETPGACRCETARAVPCDHEADLILLGCGTRSEHEARAWLTRHPRWRVHVAPRGRNWIELLAYWFPPDAPGPRRGLRTLSLRLDDVAIAWTAAGRSRVECTPVDD